MIPNQQMMGQSAPFLIRPAIPDKTRIATTPAYISVATPANQLNPVKLKQDLGRTLEAIQSSEPLKLATSMDPPIQRKRRKFVFEKKWSFNFSLLDLKNSRRLPSSMSKR